MDNIERGGLLPKPVNEGDVVEAEVVGKGKKGDIVAKYNGFVIFVKNADAKEGERIKVKITGLGKTSAFGEKA
ncbi:MAG: TRAM domain-containing protein [Candidatus Anstonellales archaeon]